MKHLSRLLILSTIASVFVACAANAGGLAKSGSLEQTLTVRETGASMTSSLKVFWKNDSMRIEQYEISGRSVQIMNGRDIYQYIPSKKMALKMTMPPGKEVSVKQVLEANLSAAKGGKKIGSAVVAGIKCDVFSVTGKGSGRSKVYVSTDSRFPVPLKSESVAGSASQVTEAKV
ncbi:MAG TPA: hypothetical protein VGK34_04875, partial [Armatimonadota bacterium]